MADAAEAANHHPDILVHGWNKVRLTLSTHCEGGLTEADLALAATIDALAERRAAAAPDRRAGCPPRGWYSRAANQRARRPSSK